MRSDARADTRTDTAPSPKERLRRMARWMRALIAFGAVCVVAVPVWIMVAESDALLAGLRAWLAASLANVDTFTVPAGLRGWMLLLALPIVSLGLFTLRQAWHLFGAYGDGVVFGPAASARLRALGWALIVAAALRPLTVTAGVLLLTWNNPPGRRELLVSVSSDDYLCLLFGGLLLAVSWAMVEARRIEQENDGFV